jgi:hypothetical protein
VFQRTYPRAISDCAGALPPGALLNAHGRKNRTSNWYIEYVVGGRTIREPTQPDLFEMPEALAAVVAAVVDDQILEIVEGDQYGYSGSRGRPRHKSRECRFVLYLLV